jgi:hypothetical protein
MACPEFEDLLSGGNADHALHCRDCRALLDAIARVDATFDSAFADISAPPGTSSAVYARVSHRLRKRGPSPVPEVLDLIGWAAVLTTAAIVVPRFATLLSSVLAELG